MKKVTTAGVLLLSLMMCSGKLLADELLTRQQAFTANEERHQWINERSGRTGVLEVSGALYSSPCILKTHEIPLPLHKKAPGDSSRLQLSLDLTGCGYGDDLLSANTPAGRTSVIAAYSALLTGKSGGVLEPIQGMMTEARMVLHGGSGKLSWYLSDIQRQRLQADTLLRLRLDYE